MMSTTTAAAAGPELVTSVEGITEYRLGNGLRILLFPDPSKPQVTVNLTVLVGSRHEGYGEAGMAHLLEHMVFKGTPTFPEVPKVLKEHGATFNGTTWLDRTNYYETMPATDDNLEFGIKLEADRMINSFVKKEDLDSEMTVVRNEFERGENSPERILSQRMMSAAYEWHNYGKSTIGNRADIERVPIESLRRFYKKFYQPDNAILVVAGDFKPEKALAYAEKYFGAIPRPERVLETTYTEEPPQDGERVVYLRRVGDVALAGAVYHICSGPHPDYAPMDVLQHILTAAPSGRLYKQLVETRMATRVEGSAYALHDPGILSLMATVAKANEPQDVLSRMTEIVESVGDEGVTKEEVDRAVRFWMKTWELSMTDSQQTAIQISDWAAQGDWRLLFIYRDRLEKVTPEEVKAVAKKYLTRNNRTAGLFLPSEKSERISVPPTPALAEMIGDYKGREAIATGEAFDVSPKNVESRTIRGRLGSGLKTALLAKKTRGETVQARLTLRFGSVESLKGLNTAAEALPTLMLRGTRSLSRQQIQDLLDENKARISGSGSVGEASFTIEATRRTLPAVLDLLRQVLREPTLPVAELDTIRNARLSGLSQQLTDPQAIAQTAVQKALSPYPTTDVRYAPSIAESIERWKALGRDDLVRLHHDFISGEHGELSIVGDFDVESTQVLLSKIFDGWTVKQPYERIPRPGNMNIAGRTEKIETPDKDNAVYFAGEVIPMKDSDPDYPAFTIGNFVLGSSGLASRLGDRIRQREGLSYGVGSGFRANSLDERAIFSAYAITNPVNMPKVDVAIREETSKIVSQGITGEELEAAQKSYLENQKVLRSDDSHLAAILGSTLEADRDMSFYGKLETQISQLTTDAVKSALQKRLSVEKLVIVMAGDFAKAEKEAAKPAAK
ncbi:pseudouridine synthase [Planctomyces sp. SCGC AG-212-M04]|nr:pseudouridine synthase [Planctomyces sp. SCGC AG-212-M04]